MRQTGKPVNTADATKSVAKVEPANTTDGLKVTLKKQPNAVNADATKGVGDKPATKPSAELAKKAEAAKPELKEQKYVIGHALPTYVPSKKTIRAFCFACAKALQDQHGSFTLDELRMAINMQQNVAIETFGVKEPKFGERGKPNDRAVQHVTWFASEGWLVPTSAEEKDKADLAEYFGKPEEKATTEATK